MNPSKSLSQSHRTKIPIHFLEPSSDLVRKHFIYSKLRKLDDKDCQQIDSEEIKKQLKSIREESLKNIEANLKELTILLEKMGAKTFYAESASDAASYVQEVLARSDLKGVCINNSSVVKEIISEFPEDIEVFDTYHASQKEIEDTTHLDYWEVPKISEDHIWKSFDIRIIKYKEPLNFVSLIGANAVSSRDGSFFFVQHFNNISSLISQSKETILVVSLEKIVSDLEQAKFISRASGFFGLKSLLLGILSYDTDFQKVHIDELPDRFSSASDTPENKIHVIILDNGRKNLLKGEFSEFLQCINCRACGAVCPRSLLMKEGEYRTPRELVHLRFSGGLSKTVDEGLYNCSLCGSCELACPLLIPLPEYLLKIREDVVQEGLAPKKHMTIGENVKTFGNPYGKGD
ncbi:MAG: lactate utilization protein [Methanomassiliicoccales archaeon]|nr:MAG: lactate utilization protein [Methanomassiliicoccales archaeon]